jgi:hypothetical protein
VEAAREVPVVDGITATIRVSGLRLFVLVLARDGSGSGKVRVSHLPARQHIRVSGVYPYPRERADKIFDPYPYPQDIRRYRATRYPPENNMRVCDHVHFTKCINSLTDII